MSALKARKRNYIENNRKKKSEREKGNKEESKPRRRKGKERWKGRKKGNKGRMEGKKKGRRKERRKGRGKIGRKKERRKKGKKEEGKKDLSPLQGFFPSVCPVRQCCCCQASLQLFSLEGAGCAEKLSEKSACALESKAQVLRWKAASGQKGRAAHLPPLCSAVALCEPKASNHDATQWHIALCNGACSK